MTSSRAEWYRFKPLYFLLFYGTAYAAITFVNNHYVLDSTLYYNALCDRLPLSRFIMQEMNRREWPGYLFCFLIVPFKALLVSACICTAIALNREKLAFATVFRIVLVAELMPLAAALARVTWLLVHNTPTLQQVQYVYPLSILSLFKTGSLPVWCLYPLQLLNVFELLYCLALAHGLRQFTPRSFGRSLRLVLASYGLGLFVWVALILVIQIAIC